MGPQARQGAQQGGLAAAGRPLDQQRLPGTQRKIQAPQQRPAIGTRHVQSGDLQRVRQRLRLDRRQRARRRVGIEEAGQAVEGGAVLRERVVRGAKERQRILHLAERLRGLHHVAQLDRAAEKALRLQQERKHHRHLAHDQVEAVELQTPVHTRPQVGDVGRKARPERGALDRLALVEGHVLGVLAQSQQRVAEVGGQPFGQEVQADQRPADAKGEQRGHDDVQVHHEHHGARDLHPRHVQRAGQVPQDRGERHQRHHGAEGADRQRARAGHERRDVLLDALVGVVHRFFDEMAAIVGARVQPIARQPIVEPDAPMDVEGLAGVAVDQRAHHVHRGQDRENAQQAPERARVERLQCAVEAVVPEREQHGHADREHRQEQQRGQRQQRPPAAPRRQVGPGQAPELASPIGPARQRPRDQRQRDGADAECARHPPRAFPQLLLPVQVHESSRRSRFCLERRGCRGSGENAVLSVA